MSPTQSTASKKLTAAQRAVNNTLADAEIKALVAAYGYNDAKLAEGSRLAQAAEAAIIAKGEAAGAYRAAIETFKTTKAEAAKAYQSLSTVARAAANPAVLTGLGLDAPMPRQTDDFIKAGLRLFGSTTSLAALAEYGYDKTRLAAERAKISAFQAASEGQSSAKGAAQQATSEQDAAIQALNKWTAQYIKIAKVALSNTQLLEKLGVTVRSGPTAAQRAARKKTTPAAPTS